MEDNQMWKCLLNEAKQCEKLLIFQDCVDLASELMCFYLENSARAKEAFEKLKANNRSFVITDMRNLAREQRKKNFNLCIIADYQTFTEIREISDEYEIEIEEKNAFKFHKILKEKGSKYNRDIFKVANIIYLYSNSESRNMDKFKEMSMSTDKDKINEDKTLS